MALTERFSREATDKGGRESCCDSVFVSVHTFRTKVSHATKSCTFYQPRMCHLLDSEMLNSLKC